MRSPSPAPDDPADPHPWSWAAAGAVVLGVLAAVTWAVLRGNRRTLLQQHAAEVRRLQQQLERDELTDLFNRRAFNRRFGQEFRRARRYGRPLSIVLLDLDHFKTINDTYGHATGDATLRTFGSLLSDLTRTTDLVARVGGDEFALLLPETEVEAAGQVVERLKVVLRAWPLVVEPATQVTVRLSVSAGVATLTPETTTEAQLLAAADRLLYLEKQAGIGGPGP
jgi:diguanylate cyclase (GGDEF)-like protein